MAGCPWQHLATLDNGFKLRGKVLVHVVGKVHVQYCYDLSKHEPQRRLLRPLLDDPQRVLQPSRDDSKNDQNAAIQRTTTPLTCTMTRTHDQMPAGADALTYDRPDDCERNTIDCEHTTVWTMPPRNYSAAIDAQTYRHGAATTQQFLPATSAESTATGPHFDATPLRLSADDPN
jgi:hypothetical protein